MICAHSHCTLSQNLDNVIKKYGYVHIKNLDKCVMGLSTNRFLGS
jgi:hypothetical protein